MSEREAKLDEFADSETQNSDKDEKTSPKGWRDISIIDLCEIGGGSTPKKSNPEYWEGGNILWTTPKDFNGPRLIETEDKITEKGAEDSTSKIYPPGTSLLVVRSGVLRHTLPVMIAETPTSVNQDIKALEPHTDDVLPEYFFQALSGLSEDIRGSCKKTGTTVESIQTNVMEQYPIPVPPLEEQEKIASVLYTVDQAIQKSEEIREKAKSLEEVAKTEFFTQGYSEWEIQESVGWRCRANQFPKDWDVKTADELMEITRGASPRPRSDNSLFGGDIPWIKIGDANRDESKRIEEVDSYVTEKGKNKSKFVEEGTLLVANSGATCGFSIFAGVDGCVHDGWLILRGYDDFSPDFLYHYINWNYDYLQSLSLGSAQTNLSTSLFGRLDIPVPPLQEQQQIVEALDSIIEFIALASTRIDRLKRFKQGLMQDLLSGEVRTHDKDIEVVDDVLQYG